MSTTTTNLRLTKPSGDELIDIAVWNDNMDILDTKIGAVGNTDLQAQVTTLAESVPLSSYPVGSIYMSVNSTSPADIFGGTWERITGKFLLCATDNGDSGASQAAGNTGGEASHTLTVDEMPQHNHSFTGSAVTSEANNRDHTHGMKSHTHSLSSHTHSYAHSNANTNGHSLTVAQMPSHTHAVKETHGSSTSNALVFDYDYALKWSTSYTNRDETGNGPIRNTGSGSAHSHGIGTYNANTGGPSNNTSGGPSDNTSNGESQNHTHSVTAAGTIGNKGGGEAHNNMPPYLSVYVWKRTA